MKILKSSTRSRDERGAAAVEFALVLPILLLLVFGAIEYGRIFAEIEVLESAAREGARAAAVRGGAGAIEDAVTLAAGTYTLDGTPTANTTCSGETIGQPVTVSWVQNFTVNVALLPVTNVDRTISGTFRCE